MAEAESELRATARAGANIALIKYWGKRDDDLNLPLNDSLSMTLSEALTITTVAYDEGLRTDEFYLDGERVLDDRARRVSRHLDRIRALYYPMFARVASVNSMPASTGLASSASGFAALTVAAIEAFGEGLPDEQTVSTLARLGSGSACRSVPGGFVHWHAGAREEDSYAETLFDANWWDLRDLCVVVNTAPKEISSAQGHRLAAAHPFMDTRQRALPGRLAAVQGALAARDFEILGSLVEQESLEMHALMLSANPACLYMAPASLAFVHAVRRWRDDGLPVYVTLDAGPNPHLLCEGRHEAAVLRRVEELAPTATVLCNRPGPAVACQEEHLL